MFKVYDQFSHIYIREEPTVKMFEDTKGVKYGPNIAFIINCIVTVLTNIS